MSTSESVSTARSQDDVAGERSDKFTGTASHGDGQFGRWRWQFGLFAVGGGLVTLLLAFLLVVTSWPTNQGIAALGVITSPIVAIVSAYFGIQATQQAAAQTAAAHEQAGEAKEEASQARATAVVAEQEAGLREEQLERERARGSEFARRVVDHVEGTTRPEGRLQGGGTRSGAAPPAQAADLTSLARSFYPELFDQ